MPTSLKQMMRVRRARVARLPGFTLVEVLVVIAIIGILVGLAVPAVNLARRSIQQRAIALECLAIAQAVEAYHNKYDDYPPDGADLTLLTRHLRKAFPNIAASEIDLITRKTPFVAGSPLVATGCPDPILPSAMEPSEALVFFLGGFSNDPVCPFSGKGGPFYILDSNGQPIKSNGDPIGPNPAGNIASIQYNPDRQSPLYDFKQAQLTLDASSGLTASSDDVISGGSPDLMPAYHPSGKKMPFLYFDSRTYQQSMIANRFATTSAGIVYPYRSTAINTKYTPTGDPNKYFRFMNEKTFQIVSAGLDDNYGGQSGLFYMFKDASSESTGSANSGDSLDLANPTTAPTYTRFLGANASTSQLDNVTNFSQGTLEDSLSN